MLVLSGNNLLTWVQLACWQVPSIRSFLTHIGASVSLAGLLIGCCDLTSMPSTIGDAFDPWLCK